MPDKLSAYHAKRDFGLTPEPRGEVAMPADRLRFVVQKHHARKLHYDFRLELDGTLKSWAVPKGPSLDPHDKRLAVHVEDHPLDYLDFEGDIPERQYGAGHVDVWDIGYWEPQGDALAAYHAGKLKFHLDGEKLHGGWTLVRTHLPGAAGKEQWLLIKEHDDEARAADEFDITGEMPDSVLSKPPQKKGKRAVRASRDVSAEETPTPEDSIFSPAAATNAVKAPLPEELSPQLATLVDEAPRGGDWVYEIKFDGYRVLARVEHGEVRLFTRDGKDWTARLPKQAQTIAALGLDSAWLDGEIVVLDRQGIPSFQMLQNAFEEKNGASILYYLFDLPYLNGVDLRQTPLVQRHHLLRQLLADMPQGMLRYSALLHEPPQRLLDGACRLTMEGIIGKLAHSTYNGRRSADWIKLKCRQRQEFVIAGYTEPQGSRQFFGALLLGVYGDDGQLRYAGRVGSGFERSVLHSTAKQLKPLRQEACPFGSVPPGVRRAGTHWVQPQLVAEVSFAEWTQDGLLRQAVFHGLRPDKPAAQIRREEAVSVPASSARSAGSGRARESACIDGVRISNAQRVIDAASGATKLQLAQYYRLVAPYLLPYLKERPVYLLRAPDGVDGERFFQKHAGRLPIPGITMLDPSLDPGHAPLMAIASTHALAGAAQMGAIELHTCNATADMIERPDCMVFDLDPDPQLPWETVVEGARLTKVALDELGLKSFIKTSGGKGLHLVVPLARRQNWEEVAAFSQAVAQHLARILPTHFSAKMGAQNRVGKIFVDYLRNQRKASTVAPYSARARPGLPVAVPVAWEELDGIGSAAHWTIATLPERLEKMTRDPWHAYFTTRQTLNAVMRRKIGLDRK